MSEYGFYLTRIFSYKGRIEDFSFMLQDEYGVKEWLDIYYGRHL